MYRVHINGVDYVAPDLAILQQWVNEGRLLSDTYVWVESMQNHVRADQVPGITFPTRTDFATPPSYGEASYPRQGYAYPTTYEKVPNNLVLAIIATACCGCMPLGVIAIVYAAQVDGQAASGNIVQARATADKAKNWAIASIVCGVIGTAIYMMLMAATGFKG